MNHKVIAVHQVSSETTGIFGAITKALLKEIPKDRLQDVLRHILLEQLIAHVLTPFAEDSEDQIHVFSTLIAHTLETAYEHANKSLTLNRVCEATNKVLTDTVHHLVMDSLLEPVISNCYDLLGLPDALKGGIVEPLVHLAIKGTEG